MARLVGDIRRHSNIIRQASTSLGVCPVHQCIHTFSRGTLLRKGTITGTPPGPQTKARAPFQGLLTLAQSVLTPVNVIVQLESVWEAWTNPRKRKGFTDLQGFPRELFARITPLYTHKNQRSPDAPGSEPHLRQRQRDAAPSMTLTLKHGSGRLTKTTTRRTNMLQPA